MPNDIDFIMHYGIPGQKWGIRRFQNLDRTRTEAGKLRYRELGTEFRRAEKKVAERSNNKPQPFRKKPIDVDEVRRRGGLNEKEALKCTDIANRIFSRTQEREPRITKEVISAVTESGSKMFGLENRLKQPGSLAAKIGSDAKEKGLSFEQASRKINDAIRFTSVSDDDNFVNAYFSTKSKLSELGYEEVKCKNYFDLYNQGKVKHKSVQCIYQNKNGDVFELQYHTPASQAAKIVKEPIYEERRRSDVSPARAKQLEWQMSNLAEYVETPKDIMRIQSH